MSPWPTCCGWPPVPRPMNQRTIAPPLGPGPVSGRGAGVMVTMLGATATGENLEDRLEDPAQAAGGADERQLADRRCDQSHSVAHRWCRNRATLSSLRLKIDDGMNLVHAREHHKP